MSPPVSIITVYYNNPEDIMRLEVSMKAHLKPDVYEWIVVDNNSKEDLSESLECVYLRQSKNVGFGAACNAGAEIARALTLFFVNPDCLFVDDCLKPLLKAMHHAQIAGPQVFYPDKHLQLSYGPFLSIAAEAKQRFLQQFERSNFVQTLIRKKSPQNPDYVSGCAMMIRSAEFRGLGGFDQRFFLYHEDVDLCKRARKKGHRVTYVPNARIVHSKGRSAAKEPKLVEKEYRKSQLLYYRKHHGPIQNFLLRTYLQLTGRHPFASRGDSK